jgi:hypothetical protein
MPKHGEPGVSRPASPAGGNGVSRPATPDAAAKAAPPPRRQRPPPRDEAEPEPEPESAGGGGGGSGGRNGWGAVMNYVDLDHDDELTASMRPYSKLVHDVSRLSSLLNAAAPQRRSSSSSSPARARAHGSLARWLLPASDTRAPA